MKGLAEEKRRVELLSDARVLIAWLEANPDVPVDSIGITYHVPSGDDERGVAELHRIAAAMNAPVRVEADGEHHIATTTVGRVGYRAVYIEREHMRRYDEHMKSYREANREPAEAS